MLLQLLVDVSGGVFATNNITEVQAAPRFEWLAGRSAFLLLLVNSPRCGVTSDLLHTIHFSGLCCCSPSFVQTCL